MSGARLVRGLQRDSLCTVLGKRRCTQLPGQETDAEVNRRAYAIQDGKEAWKPAAGTAEAISVN